MFKVFDDKNDKPHFLFHALEGSREVPLGIKIKAERKRVTDGSGVTKYESGFHIFPDIKAVKEWSKSVTNFDNRVVVKVQCWKLRPKSHSRQNILLADKMIVEEDEWGKRQKLVDIIDAKNE